MSFFEKCWNISVNAQGRRWPADKAYLTVGWYLFGKGNSDTVARDDFLEEKKKLLFHGPVIDELLCIQRQRNRMLEEAALSAAV